MKFALIDLGSNTSKVMVSERTALKNEIPFRVLSQSSYSCRLLPSCDQSKRVIEKGMLDRLLHCLQQIRSQLSDQSVERIEAVGTAAFRLADNALEVVEQIYLKTGISVRVLSGSEEAQAVARGLLCDPELSQWDQFVAFDLGGGSLELLEVEGRALTLADSLPLGAVALSQLFPGDGSRCLTKDDQIKVRSQVRSHLSRSPFSASGKNHRMAAAGGTMVYLRRILEKRVMKTPNSVLLVSDVQTLTEEVSMLCEDDRSSAFPDLPKDRADVFPFGLLAALEVMDFFQVDRLTHSYHNLRHGLTAEFFENATHHLQANQEKERAAEHPNSGGSSPYPSKSSSPDIQSSGIE